MDFQTVFVSPIDFSKWRLYYLRINESTYMLAKCERAAFYSILF